MNIVESRSMVTAICVTAGLLIFQALIYFGSEKVQSSPHDVRREFDQRIPFAPEWVYVYVLWFPLIAVFPLALFMYDQELYLVYLASILADIIFSVAIYLYYPTTFQRPQPPDTISGRALRLVYQCSYKGLNCMPSMHCSQCFIILTMAFFCSLMPIWMRLLFAAVSMGIVYATMAIKQHVVLDVLTALPTAFISMSMGFVFVSFIIWGQ